MLTLLLLSVVAADPGCEAKGVEACRAACKAKQAPACLSLGNLLREDEKATAEMLKAFESACALKLPEGCSKLGTWLLKTSNDPGTPKRAAQLFNQACQANDALGCSNYAGLMADGLGVEKNAAESTRLFEKACTLKDSFACGAAGVSYLSGDGVKQDEARGVKLIEQGCTMGSTNACVSLAALDRFGRAGRKRDPAKAAPVFIKACKEEQDPAACASLADMYRTGEGVTRDAARAAELRRMSCQLGVEDMCDQQGKPTGPAMAH